MALRQHFFTELFSTEVRYSGATLGYQFGAILGGAFAPTIAALLWKDLRYILGICIHSLRFID